MRKFKKLKQKTFRRNRGHFFLQEHQKEAIKSLYDSVRKHAKENNVIHVLPRALTGSTRSGYRSIDDFFPINPGKIGIDLEYHMNNRPTDGSVVVRRMCNGGRRG